MGRRDKPTTHYRGFHVRYTVPGSGGGGALWICPTLAGAQGHTVPPGFTHPTFIEEVVQHTPLGKLHTTRTHRWHSRRGWVPTQGAAT